MKGLSLWQPWASAMATGLKLVETRAWKTNYRGDVLICAALQRPRRCDFDTDVEFQFAQTFPFGKALCVVELTDCIPTDEIGPWLSKEEESWGDYSPGRFAWMTTNLRPLIAPIHFRGKQGLFSIPDGNAERLRKNMRANI